MYWLSDDAALARDDVALARDDVALARDEPGEVLTVQVCTLESCRVGCTA